MSELMRERQREISLRRKQNRPFMCIETGMVFYAPYEVDEYLGKKGAYQSIKRALDKKCEKSYKRHWRYID